MRYALLICNDETVTISPEENSERLAAFEAFGDRMRERGVLLGGERRKYGSGRCNQSR